MSDIQQYQHPTPAIQQALQELDMDDLQVGDIFIKVDGYHYSDIVRVVGFSEKKGVKYVLSLYALNWEATEWGNGYNGKHDPKFGPFHEHSLEGFKDSYIKDDRSFKLERGKTIQQYFEEAAEVIAGKRNIDDYQTALIKGNVNEERALIHKGSKEVLAGMQNALEQGKNKVELIRTFVTWEMERRKAELNKIKDQLQGIVAKFEKQITRIMRVITTIELYLGIDEEIFQLQDGPKASDMEPIQFRQGLLYMEEEVAEWREGGFDDSDINKFDEWLITNNNFKKLLPEAKGMVMFRPRRESKYYDDDAWI